MIEGFINAINALSSVTAMGIIILGTVIGLIFGVLPGLGGVTALAILLPFTYGWDPKVAMFFFAGILGAVPFGGSISAILLNTPGTAENAASCFDGHPMSQRGEGGRALGISATASGLGGLFGAALLLALIPALRRIILAFGPAEFFFLALFGLVCVTFAVKGNMLKGLISGGVGMLISFIGYSNVFGSLRFNFGSEYLWDGIKLVPFLVGLLAVSEAINYSVKGQTLIAKKSAAELGGVFAGVKDVMRNKACFFRSAVLGTIIGIIPGVGASVANFLAYTVAVQSSRHPERFGTGEPAGLTASEASNNACVSGAFLPTVAFGVPGSAAMAIVLGIFVLHGLEPGPLLIRDHMDVLFAIILGLAVSNVLASLLGLATANYLARITTVKSSYLVPLILILCFAGVFAYRESIWDVVLALLAGFFGYALKANGFPIICMVIGYVLGVIAEGAFRQALMVSQGSYAIFFTRPVAVTLFFLIIFILLFPIVKKKRALNERETQ